jgi:hypothetical protein
MTRIRMGLLPGLLLALTLAVAACGGGGGGGGKGEGVASLGDADSATSTTVGGSQDERQAALNWTRCMRQHGIDVPGPQITANGIGQPKAGVKPDDPRFKAAEQACRQYEPNGGQPTPPSAQERQRALAFARCMRQHGIDVPDPKFTADGIDQPFPTGVARDDPRLRAAERACGQFLPPDEPGGGGK